MVCQAPSADAAAAAAAALLPHKNVSENAEGGKEVRRAQQSLTHLANLLSPAVNAAQQQEIQHNHSNVREGGVLSRGWPSPKAGTSAMAKERGGRKMLTS